jgi:hypothetical protein
VKTIGTLLLTLGFIGLLVALGMALNSADQISGGEASLWQCRSEQDGLQKCSWQQASPQSAIAETSFNQAVLWSSITTILTGAILVLAGEIGARRAVPATGYPAPLVNPPAPPAATPRPNAPGFAQPQPHQFGS